MTAQNPFYRPVSEKDSQEGYVNLFLHPLLDIYKDMSHSYIIELKYAKGKDSSERIEQLRRQAIEQAERYASSESVQKAIVLPCYIKSLLYTEAWKWLFAKNCNR